jgi:hypothetical protein
MRGAATAPSFADLDSNGDGRLDRDELHAGREAHMALMRQEHGGRHGGCKCKCKGEGGGHGHARPMPTFGDLDLDGNGCIDAEEFAKHQAERHGRHDARE